MLIEEQHLGKVGKLSMIQSDMGARGLSSKAEKKQVLRWHRRNYPEALVPGPGPLLFLIPREDSVLHLSSWLQTQC